MAAGGDTVSEKMLAKDGLPGRESSSDHRLHAEDSEKSRASDSGEDEGLVSNDREEGGHDIGPSALHPDSESARPSQRSRASSFVRGGLVVPRNQRRGLFGRFTIVPELESSYDYKNSTKWVITAVIALAAAAAPMGSSIFMRECQSVD
jgi:hypothetical protein